MYWNLIRTRMSPRLLQAVAEAAASRSMQPRQPLLPRPTTPPRTDCQLSSRADFGDNELSLDLPKLLRGTPNARSTLPKVSKCRRQRQEEFFSYSPSFSTPPLPLAFRINSCTFPFSFSCTCQAQLPVASRLLPRRRAEYRPRPHPQLS